MASFPLGQPVTTAEARVVVDAGLKPGFHRFRLVVVDDAGQASQADEAVVQVVEQVVTPVNVNLTPVTLVTNPATPVISPAVLAPLRPRRRTR